MISGNPISFATAMAVSRSLTGSSVPGSTGTSASRRKGSRGHLVAHHVEQFVIRADEGDSRIGAGLRELGVLREEPVARVDRVDIFSLC